MRATDSDTELTSTQTKAELEGDKTINSAPLLCPNLSGTAVSVQTGAKMMRMIFLPAHNVRVNPAVLSVEF